MKHGSNLVFKLDNAAGSLIDLTAKVKNVDMSRSVESSDETTAGVTSKVYIPGLMDAQFSISGPFDPTVDAHMDGILAKIGSFEYSPEGTASGSPKYAGECILTAFSPSAGVSGGAVQYSASFQCTGAITRTTN